MTGAGRIVTDWPQEVAARWDRIERKLLRLEAANAQRCGIDIFQPGWRDAYQQMIRERNDEIDSLIATPHVDEAISRMEEQFGPGTVTS